MTFATLIDELEARGFDYLSTTRSGQYINQSYKALCDRAPWPFLETTTTGTAPLTVSDLRAVLGVVDSTATSTLRWIDRRNLIQRGYTLTTTGTPTYWYQTSRTVISVYPANTSDTLSVHYIKVPATLTGTDAHVIPTEYEDLIIDGAAIKAYKDRDNFDAAAALTTHYEEQVRRMMDSLLSRNHDTHDYTQQTPQTYEAGGWGAVSDPGASA